MGKCCVPRLWQVSGILDRPRERLQELGGPLEKKYGERAETWFNPKLGFCLNCLIYQVFVCSVLSFVWQLEKVPDEILQEETRIMRMFTPGPGNLINKNWLFHLKDSLGFQIAYPSIFSTALAAKLRVASSDVRDATCRHW